MIEMDARQMKKIIQYEALIALRTNLSNTSDLQFEYGTMLDIEKVTLAQIQRFRRVLDSMIETAESKLD
jgi:hypothetical protein